MRQRIRREAGTSWWYRTASPGHTKMLLEAGSREQAGSGLEGSGNRAGTWRAGTATRNQWVGFAQCMGTDRKDMHIPGEKMA